MQTRLFIFCLLSSVCSFAQYPITSVGYNGTAPYISDASGNRLLPSALINAKGTITTQAAQSATGLMVNVDNSSNLIDVALSLNMGTTSKNSKVGILSNGSYNTTNGITGINLFYENAGTGRPVGMHNIIYGQDPLCYNAASYTNSGSGISRAGSFLSSTLPGVAGGTATAYGLESRAEAGLAYGLYVTAAGTSANAGTAYGVYARAYGAITNYAGFFDGNVLVSGTFTNPSDARLKQNIHLIGDALPKVMQLTPANYEFKTDTYQEINLAKGTHYGFLAQDIEKVFPTLVSENPMVVSRSKQIRNDKSDNLVKTGNIKEEP